ncbi:MAG: glycyl-radical enzyme activating protein [Lachnospiraceae bacterium]
MGIRVFDIQRFSLQDGPGIRTTVFMKGCPLHCRWCHNPESISSEPDYMFYRDKCTGCGMCAKVCEQQVHIFRGGIHSVDRSRCNYCRNCTAVCPQDALAIAGEIIGGEKLLGIVNRDRMFYEETGGGVTFSGGEPLHQAEQLFPVLQRCKESGLHTAVETASLVPWDRFELLYDYVDLWICDVKAVTKERHIEGCGAGNQIILSNLRQLAGKKDAHIWIRTPVIPGFNDGEEEMRKIRDFTRSLGEAIRRTELLSYHDTGRSKYDALGKEYLMSSECTGSKIKESSQTIDSI